MAGARAQALKARKAVAAASSSKFQASVDELFQPEAPALLTFTDHTTHVSDNARRKRAHETTVEAPSPGSAPRFVCKALGFPKTAKREKLWVSPAIQLRPPA
uniref:Uncharacterized protein n=1 Tax=Mycena chlorophos TaxID=658473 RepID=A0ABQ0L9M6_MYCCL|nr:predicted protein [Mycena chlorophos]